MDARKELRHYLTDLLARREYTRAELTRKLKTKSDDEVLIVALLDEAAGAGLQSDRRFCEGYVRYRSEAGIGARRISLELRDRGVANDLINEYVWQSNVDWELLIARVWAKKYESRPNSRAEYAKQQRFLLQRGFEPELIQRILNHEHEKLK